MTSFTLSALPGELTWQERPLTWQHEPDDTLTIVAGPQTDWFVDPAGTVAKANAPVALFTPPDSNFRLCAKVTVDFAAMFDAGVLHIHAGPERWAKLCFEQSPQGQMMVVSVVTRGVSDDCNSVVLTENTVYLRITQAGQATAFHYSHDARYWRLVRYFTLGPAERLRIGFSAQSPTGQQCRARFTEIAYQPGLLKDLRNGE